MPEFLRVRFLDSGDLIFLADGFFVMVLLIAVPPTKIYSLPLERRGESETEAAHSMFQT